MFMLINAGGLALAMVWALWEGEWCSSLGMRREGQGYP